MLSSLLCLHPALLLLESDRGHNAILGVVDAELIEHCLLFLGVVREPDFVHAVEVCDHLVVDFGLWVLFEKVLQCFNTLSNLICKDFGCGQVVRSDDVSGTDRLYLTEVFDCLFVVCIEYANKSLVQ